MRVMKLSAYLGEHAIPDTTFAALIGVTRQSLWRYKSGERRPDWEVLERIARATEGHVTPNDFLDETPSSIDGTATVLPSAAPASDAEGAHA